MLLFDAPLTFREYIVHEVVPLADVFRDVLSFLREREDAVLFGAQAINAYCEPPRMTGDVDVLSTHGRALAETIRERLAERFQIAVHACQVADGRGFRVYQLRKPKNRHLVDVRQVDVLPEFQCFEGVRVAAPAELDALEVLSIDARRGREKELSDRLDVHRLLRAFPQLHGGDGEVARRLRGIGANDAALALWRSLTQDRVEPDPDDEY